MNEKIAQNLPYILAPALDERSSISLIDILGVIRDNIKIVILTPLIISIVAIIYVLFIAEPIYVSKSTLLPSTSDDGMSEMRGMASQFGFNVPGGSDKTDFSSKEMYIEILKSRTLANSLLDREFETKKYGPAKSLLKILTYDSEESEYGLDTLRHMAITSLLKDVIKVSKDSQSPLLTLRVSTIEPVLSAEVNRAVIDELDSLQRKIKVKKTSEKRIFIEGRTQAVGKELIAAEEALKVFRDNNRQIQNSPTLLLRQQRLTREIQVQTEVFIALKQQLELAKIETIQKESLIQILDEPNVPLFPETPKKKLIVFISGVIGGMLGIIISFMRNALIPISIIQEEKLEK